MEPSPLAKDMERAYYSRDSELLQECMHRADQLTTLWMRTLADQQARHDPQPNEESK